MTVIADFGRVKAVVDPEDFGPLSAFRYRLLPNGTPVRTVGGSKRNASLARDVADRMGLPPGRQVRHRNKDAADCRRANLEAGPLTGLARRGAGPVPLPAGVHRRRAHRTPDGQAAHPPAAYWVTAHAGPCARNATGLCLLARGEVTYLGSAHRVKGTVRDSWRVRDTGGEVATFGTFAAGAAWLAWRYRTAAAA